MDLTRDMTIKETDNEIIIEVSSSMQQRTKTVKFNKYTRVMTSEEKDYDPLELK